MNVILSKIALQEFEEAKEFYEIERSGLGARFAKEIERAILRIQQFPFSWPVERPDVRRYFIHKFPYKIFYSIQEDKIVILAFAHLHREPDYWFERIK